MVTTSTAIRMAARTVTWCGRNGHGQLLIRTPTVANRGTTMLTTMVMVMVTRTDLLIAR
jgi:hypothetical protein